MDVRNIIKYNTERKYFGNWSPKQLHEAYQNSSKSEQNTSYELATDRISVDDICETLWTEMSYNPLRFGKTSPFVFDGVNSINKFCTKYDFQTLDDNANKVLFKIKLELIQFMNLIAKYDNSFVQNGITKSPYMKIKLEEYSQHSNNEYKILSRLTACIHTVCKQNLQDYNKSKKYRTTITQVCTQRHPDGKRKIKNPCFSKIESLTETKNAILQQIACKNSEILETQMRIEALSEYEIPVDVSYEQEKIKKQNADLQYLDSRLQYIQQQLSMLIK